MNHLDLNDPTIRALGGAAVLFAAIAVVMSFSQVRAAWRHIGLKRMQYINTTTSAPADVEQKRAPLKFPEEPFDIEAYVARISAPQPPEPPEELERWQIKNWRMLPASVRRECVDHLRATFLKFPDGAAVLAKWWQQKQDGHRIGHDEWGFHHGSGKFVRNTLRGVLPDKYLPAVAYEHANGQKFSNWDDYFYGCLDELASRPLDQLAGRP